MAEQSELFLHYGYTVKQKIVISTQLSQCLWYSHCYWMVFVWYTKTEKQSNTNFLCQKNNNFIYPKSAIATALKRQFNLKVISFLFSLLLAVTGNKHTLNEQTNQKLQSFDSGLIKRPLLTRQSLIKLMVWTAQPQLNITPCPPCP